MEHAIEFMTGIVLLVLGLSFLLRVQDWSAWFEDVRQDGQHRALPIGCFVLALGAFMVSFHQVWSGFFLFVTVVGVLGIIEGSFYLLFPGSLRSVLSALQPHYKCMLRSFGIAMILVALLILNKLSPSLSYNLHMQTGILS